jgi:Zn-dependent protease
VIFIYVQVLREAPLAFLMLAGAFASTLLLSLSFHEFSHARVADSLGDRTPRSLGRLTLNPKAHLDPVGSFLILVIGFGWAKPVPINPSNTRNPQQTLAMTAAAGPLSNFVMAGVAGIPIKLGLVPFYHPFINPSFARQWARVWTDSPEDMAGLLIGTFVLLNVVIGVFNFIPLPPLDGFNLLFGLAPRELAPQLARIAPWGPGILFLLIVFPFISGGEFSPLGELMGPPIDLLVRVFTGGELPFRFG